MMKNEKLKPLLIPLLLCVVQGLTYLLIKPFQTNIHVIGNGIDTYIPYVGLFVICYCSWFVMLFAIPYMLYQKDKKMLAKYIVCHFFGVLTCYIIFLIYPTTVIRPEILTNNIFDKLVGFIYLIDTPTINCMPSIHCLLSMLFILTAWCSKKFNTKFKIIVTIISILIMLSTLFIKQHAVIDLVTGDIIMTIVFLCVNSSKKIVNKVEKMLNN